MGQSFVFWALWLVNWFVTWELSKIRWATLLELKPFLVILKSFMEVLVHDDVIGGLACPVIIIRQSSFHMMKVLLCRFQQCWGMFTMLLLEGFSQTRLFRHLSDQLFGVRNFEITKSMKVIFFVKMFKSSSRFQNCRKKFRKSSLILR